MNKLKILFVCLISTISFAQNKASKTQQDIKVNKDVVVDLNTNYVQIEIDTWNKNEVSIDAYLESDKLSKEELEKALKKWNLNIDATKSTIIISSKDGAFNRFDNDNSYDAILKNLELNLVEFPEFPEFPELTEMPELPEFPNIDNLITLPVLPEMPEFPELPELPDGIKSVSFDYEKYKKDGESYLKEWSKKYEKKGGKELQKRMEKWAREFEESGYKEKMKNWGENFEKKFEKDMEKWEESFGENHEKDIKRWREKMEIWNKQLEERMKVSNEKLRNKMQQANEKRKNANKKRSEVLTERKQMLLERKEVRRKALEERKQVFLERKEEKRRAIEERKQNILNHRNSSWTKQFENGYNNSGVKRVIKIKIPKNAKLKLNVRHSELKMASLLNNIQGDVSHSFLVAEHIDGSNTSINVSHSPVIINKWDLGTLNLNFVNKAQIKTATNLVLNAKSSNISILNLRDTAIIDGSFGDLTISNLTETFKNLNLVLENSDALISLPQNLDYNLYFKGNRSKFNNKTTTQKTVRKDDNGQNGSKNIVVNAKFSNVIVN